MAMHALLYDVAAVVELKAKNVGRKTGASPGLSRPGPVLQPISAAPTRPVFPGLSFLAAPTRPVFPGLPFSETREKRVPPGLFGGRECRLCCSAGHSGEAAI